MQQVSVDEAKERLSDLIDAALRGEVVSIAVDQERVVELVPSLVHGGRRKFGSAKGLVQIADDFDAPLEELEEYTK